MPLKPPVSAMLKGSKLLPDISAELPVRQKKGLDYVGTNANSFTIGRLIHVLSSTLGFWIYARVLLFHGALITG